MQIGSRRTSTKIQAFLPDQVSGMGLWIDPSMLVYSDAGTTLAVNNDPVYQVVCRKHGHVYSQPTLAARPTLITNGINGRPVLRLDGTDDVLLGDAMVASLLNGSTGFTVFVVAKSAASTLARFIYWSITANTNNRYFLGRSSTTEQFAFRVLDADAGVTISSPARSYNGTSAYVISHSHDIANQSSTLYQNGTAGATTSSSANFSAGSITNTSSSTARLGGQGANFTNGDIAEAILYQRVLSEAERTKVTRYLARKFAVTIV